MSSIRPVKCAVAVVLERPGRPGTFLAVRRPDDDAELPGVWGLPAVTLEPGELPEAGVRRIGREKLAARIEPVAFVGIAAARREGYELILMDLSARLMAGEPDVRSAPTHRTRYVNQAWTADPSRLAEAARRGSVCSRVYLEALGIDYGERA